MALPPRLVLCLGFGLGLGLAGCVKDGTGATGTGGGSSGGSSASGGSTGTGGRAATGGTTGSGGTATGGAIGSGGIAGTGGAMGSGGAGTGGVTGTGGSTGSGGTTASGGRTGGGGSGTGGAGTGGAATGGAGPCGGFPFCDDFESGTAGQAPDALKWTIDLLGGNGTVRIDAAVGHNSSKSLQVNNTSFHTMAMVKGAPVFPLPNGVLAGRAYVRIAGAMPTGHVIWIEAGAVANDTFETRFGANIGALDINRWPGDTEQRAPAAKLGAGTWHCIEFVFDRNLHDARIWMDNVELTDLHVTNWVAPMQQNGNNSTPIPNWTPDYQAVRFGWELGSGQIWYDDVVLGHARIGCM